MSCCNMERCDIASRICYVRLSCTRLTDKCLTWSRAAEHSNTSFLVAVYSKDTSKLPRSELMVVALCSVTQPINMLPPAAAGFRCAASKRAHHDNNSRWCSFFCASCRPC